MRGAISSQCLAASGCFAITTPAQPATMPVVGFLNNLHPTFLDRL